MNLKEIYEHTVDLDLLDENSNILDLGCRGFLFKDYIEQNKLGKVYSVDIDDFDRSDYYKIAISNEDGMCSVVHTHDPQAKHIKDGNDLKKMTIDSFSKMVGVEKWDLIKIDIEGEEYKIIGGLNHPVAKQVSIEFHEHCDCKIGKEALDNLLNWIENYYDVYNKNWEERHGCTYNYWDILLISKNLK
jgi:FkbM family methyltransferase